MKFILALAFLITIVAADIPESFKEKAKQFMGECMQENKISLVDFDKLKKGEHTGLSQDVKCFANCFQEKAGISKDGVFQEEAVLAIFSDSVGADKTKAAIEACRDVKGSDKCDTSFKAYQCFKKNGVA